MDGLANGGVGNGGHVEGRSRIGSGDERQRSTVSGHEAIEDVERKKRLKKVGNYVLGDVLGEGAYGQVREGLSIKENGLEKDGPKFGLRVAVKIISRRLLRKVPPLDNLLLRILLHPLPASRHATATSCEGRRPRTQGLRREMVRGDGMC